jgi:hypothetical protein
MGRACRIHGRDDKLTQNIVGNVKGEDIGRVPLQGILRMDSEGVDLFGLE